MGAVAGSQALEKFANEKPDLVILDIMMPGLDGFEVCGLGYRLGDYLVSKSAAQELGGSSFVGRFCALGAEIT